MLGRLCDREGPWRVLADLGPIGETNDARRGAGWLASAALFALQPRKRPLKRFQLLQDAQPMIGGQAIRSDNDPASLSVQQFHIRELAADIKVGIRTKTKVKVWPARRPAPGPIRARPIHIAPRSPSRPDVLRVRRHIMHQDQRLIAIEIGQKTLKAPLSRPLEKGHIQPQQLVQAEKVPLPRQQPLVFRLALLIVNR